MEIFPAIDLRDKKVVRLKQGDYDQMTIFHDSPLDTANSFVDSGAKNLHMVDLDGALNGELCNFEVIEKIALKTNMFIEVGGGIRDIERIKKYLDCGVSRIILGTIACTNYNFVEKAVEKFGDKIAVGVDAKNEKVAINGWKTITDINSIDFCKKLNESGVDCIIYTDISKDGMMSGTNLNVYKKLNQIKGLKVVASGGITYLNEIEKLNAMDVYGAILGKALYMNKIVLKDAIEVSEV